MNLDLYLTLLKNQEILDENTMKKICIESMKLLCSQPNVIYLSTPIIVVGDIHGQFFDLLNIFKIGGDNKKYLFLGDYVNRGDHSLETISYLLILKLKYPNKIHLLRGNHESRQISQIWGYYDQIKKVYGNGHIWLLLNKVCDLLSIAAVIDNKIFCVHAGLSKDISRINQIKCIIRKREIPQEGAFTDLLWSIPSEDDKDDDNKPFQESPMGAGWVFSSRVCKNFLHLNDLSLICRSHTLIKEGFKYHFNEKYLLTIWSAPNYCYRCGNSASIFEFDKNLKGNPRIFKEDEDSHCAIENRKEMYFI